MVVGTLVEHAGDAADLARDLSANGLPAAPAWLESIPPRRPPRGRRVDGGCRTRRGSRAGAAGAGPEGGHPVAGRQCGRTAAAGSPGDPHHRDHRVDLLQWGKGRGRRACLLQSAGRRGSGGAGAPGRQLGAGGGAGGRGDCGPAGAAHRHRARCGRYPRGGDPRGPGTGALPGADRAALDPGRGGGVALLDAPDDGGRGARGSCRSAWSRWTT